MLPHTMTDAPLAELLTTPLDQQHLPKVLRDNETPISWLEERRSEILAFYERYVYGAIPPRPARVEYNIISENLNAFDGLATRREIEIHCYHGSQKLIIPVLWYLPNQTTRAVPCIVGLNFCGNAGCTDEEDIILDTTEERGFQKGRWELPFLLKSQVGVITAPRNAIFPDDYDGRAQSIYKLFYKPEELTQENRSLTAISAWAAGYRLLLELAETDTRINSRNIWAHGHSRLGKTALWIGANEPRFSGVVSNDSGCCGAALLRGATGEKIRDIVKRFPYWFCAEFDRYQNQEELLNFDQHFLLALIAPRPLLVASASEDEWASPKCEFAATLAVSEVYKLFGAQGLPSSTTFPEPDQALFGDYLAYTLRSGKHNVTRQDWEFVLNFMKHTSKLQ